MNQKESILVNIPVEKAARMKAVMKRERQTNKTAFIVNAIDMACEGQERIETAERLEKMINILAENARIDREESAKRHNEIMAWLDIMAQAILDGDQEDFKNFQIAVEQKKREKRGN
jgi:hypothetical protein